MSDDAASAHPLFEHDDTPRAYLEPSEQIRPLDVPRACVVTFFGDAVQRLLDSGRARVLAANRWEDGPHPLLEVEHEGERLAILQSGVGAPLAGALLEQAIASGCRSFVACGGAGSLHSHLPLGHLVVVREALRDEGTSFHYVPAARYIDAHAEATAILEETLTDHQVPFAAGRTWTTDAPYRETHAKVAARREEGCLTVEMEASALAAVARFRGVPLAQVLYGGDDLSGEQWDGRSWQSQADVRDNLLALAGSAALRVERWRVGQRSSGSIATATNSRLR